MKFIQKIKPYLTKIDQALDLYIPSDDTPPSQLHQAIRYSIQAGGKRLRPVLTLLASELWPNHHNPLPAALAIESIHTYSLIHDDLPCMDNSPLRRGQPSCHVKFDEATALLAGDALLTLAFEILSTHYSNNPQLALSLIQDLSKAANSKHLIGGQMQDLLSEQHLSSQVAHSSNNHFSSSINNSSSTHTTTLTKITPTHINLDSININKTGHMFAAALTLGVRMATSDTTIIQNYHLIGLHIGQAFQIVDDILDETSTEEILGKPTNQDTINEKITYPKLHGLEKAKQEVQHHTQTALQLCKSSGGNNQLILELIEELQQRIH
jgi:geranylgeranyl diphosphate synthase type II